MRKKLALRLDGNQQRGWKSFVCLLWETRPGLLGDLLDELYRIVIRLDRRYSAKRVRRTRDANASPIPIISR